MRIVTLPVSAAAHPASFAQKAKDAGADVLEIRGDLTPHIEAFSSSLPILLALRGAPIDVVGILKPTYLDLERGEEGGKYDGLTLVRSYHNYDRTPTLRELQDIVTELIGQGGEIIKIATLIQSYEDLVTLERVRESLPATQKRVIVGMGEKAHLSRALSLHKNTFTYTYLTSQSSSALGQLPMSFYQMIDHTKKPTVYGLLGGGQIRTSKSPEIHNALFAAHGTDAIFSLFPTDDIEEAYNNLAMLGVQGFSVTSPWKKQILTRLTRVEGIAQRIGSVNTVVRHGDEWVGYSTDVEGIVQGYPFIHDCKRIAIVGSGGVVPAVIAACEDMHRGCSIQLFARNKSAREELAELFDIRTYEFDRIHTCECDVVICAVSEDSAIPLPQTHENRYALDLRYGKKTKFLKTAESLGYRTYDGLHMLVYQALAQHSIWTGQEATDDDADRLFSLMAH